MSSRSLTEVRRWATVAVGLVLGVTGCKSATDACDPSDPFCGSGGPVPTTIRLDPDMFAVTTGATRQIQPTVLDQDSQTIAGVTVTWRSDNQGVASVSASGLVRAEGLGTTRVHATAGSATAGIDVVVCPLLATMTFGGERFDNLATTDCRLPDGSYSDWLTLDVASANAGLLQIDLLSGTLDAYVYLLGANDVVVAEDDDHENEIGAQFYDFGARIRQSLNAGRYTIVATSYLPQITGAYQLSVGPGLFCAEEASLALGGSTSGQALASDDCSYDGFFADAYVVRVTSNSTVNFTLTSPAFDAFLTLLDPSGNVVFNDNNGAGGTDARISRSLTPAWYVIEVSSNLPGATGGYTLTFN